VHAYEEDAGVETVPVFGGEEVNVAEVEGGRKISRGISGFRTIESASNHLCGKEIS
jgi:hypothetical protein